MPKQFLIETDILLDFLHHTDETKLSVLRRCLSLGSCYTTMVNAMEVFRAAKKESQHKAAMDLLSGIRVLGFNFRYAPEFARIASEAKIELTDREAMVLGMAKVSQLIVITERYYDRYCEAAIVSVARTGEQVP